MISAGSPPLAAPLDPRIGTLVRQGRVVYYAMVNGYGKPPLEGDLATVEAALGLRRTPALDARDEPPERAGAVRKPAREVRRYRDFVVTLTFHADPPYEEEITVSARSRDEALKAARDWKRIEHGRTRSCQLAPCTFRARRARET